MAHRMRAFSYSCVLHEEIFDGLLKAIELVGGYDHDIKKIAENRSLRIQIAKLLVDSRTTSNVHRVTVDRSRTLKLMIKAGKYGEVHQIFSKESFPIEGTGKTKVDIELVHYGRNMSTEAVLKDLENRHFRPATIEELLALGSSKPALQRKFPIVALGWVIQRSKLWRHFPCLDYGFGFRLFDLEAESLEMDYCWDGRCRFAAVHK